MASLVSTRRAERLESYGLPLLYVLLLGWLLIGPLWGEPGLPNSADGLLHLHRGAAVARSWTAGIVWPRWFPDVYQGLGAPVFHYYSPLFYLSVAPLQILGLPLDLSVKLVLSGFFVGSGLATWAWLRRLLSPAAGYAGAALYLSQPHLFREYYFRGDYPQVLALLLLPVVLWAFTRLYEEDHWINWLAAPLSLVALVTAHNITALLSIAVLVLYWLAMPLWRRNWAGWRRGILAALLAMGLAAFFWLPSVADINLVRSQNLWDKFYHYSQYFVRWQDLLAAPPLFDQRAANPPFPHLLGWAAWLALVGGVIALAVSFVRRTGWNATRVWATVGLVITALCLALTQAWSTPVWEALPFMALVQFPGRLLGPAAVGVALAGGAAVTWPSGRYSWFLMLGLILAVGISSAAFLFPHQPFLPIESLTAADTQTYERRSNVWGTTGSNEFLPRWADPARPRAAHEARVRFLPAGSKWNWETPHRAVLQAAPGGELPSGPLILPSHFFPAWEAEADGQKLAVEPSETGLLRLDMPTAAHSLVVRWVGTSWQRRGQWLSLLALAAWLCCLGWAARRGATARRELQTPPIRSLLNSLAPVGLVILLVLGRDTIRLLELGWFQRVSPLGAVEHVEHPLQATLGGNGQPAVALLGWELLSRGSPRPGSQLRARLYWQGQGRIAENLHSFVHLYVPALQQGWAGVQNDNPGQIPTSRWRPALYYVDDLTMDLPADLPPGLFTLAVGMATGNGERLAVSGSPDDLILLDEIRIEPLVAGPRQPLIPSTSAPARFGNSLRLQGYDLLADAGGPVLRLYWEVLKTPSADFMTFLHVLDGEGNLLAQFDAPPLEGLVPTSHWPDSSLMIDRHKLWLAPDLPEPHYLRVGLYDPDTARRLAVYPDAGAADHFDADDALVVPFDLPPSP
jgi:hypothetical protein